MNGTTDPFEEMVADLDLDVPDFDPSGLSNLELAAAYHEARDKLLELGQMISPSSEEAEEWAVRRGTCMIELRKRGLL